MVFQTTTEMRGSCFVRYFLLEFFLSVCYYLHYAPTAHSLPVVVELCSNLKSLMLTEKRQICAKESSESFLSEV